MPASAEITLPLREFLERPAPIPRPERQGQFDYGPFWAGHRRQRTREEFASRDRPCSGRTDESDFGIAGHRDARQFGSWVGMGKAATDGAAVTDLIMRDVRNGLPQQRVCGPQELIVLDVTPA